MEGNWMWMDRRKGWVWIEEMDGDGQKDRMGMDRRKVKGMDKGGGQTQGRNAPDHSNPPPLNTPLVRMDKGTIDCDGFIK